MRPISPAMGQTPANRLPAPRVFGRALGTPTHTLHINVEEPCQGPTPVHVRSCTPVPSLISQPASKHVQLRLQISAHHSTPHAARGQVRSGSRCRGNDPSTFNRATPRVCRAAAAHAHAAGSHLCARAWGRTGECRGQHCRPMSAHMHMHGSKRAHHTIPHRTSTRSLATHHQVLGVFLLLLGVVREVVRVQLRHALLGGRRGCWVVVRHTQQAGACWACTGGCLMGQQGALVGGSEEKRQRRQGDTHLHELMLLAPKRVADARKHRVTVLRVNRGLVQLKSAVYDSVTPTSLQPASSIPFLSCS